MKFKIAEKISMNDEEPEGCRTDAGGAGKEIERREKW